MSRMLTLILYQADYEIGRGSRILSLPSLRLRRLSRQVVRPAPEDGLSRGHDVFASIADAQLDREGH
jgi:hypothetical protein